MIDPILDGQNAPPRNVATNQDGVPAAKSNRSPQLVILAAGLGSRYGGLKQLEAVGPGGATLMDYSLYDARRAGFADAVFVIRPEMQEAFDNYATRFVGHLPWRAALQRLEDVPPGVAIAPSRTKPWGTAQAVLAAESHVQGPFAVLNADDFYGAEAFVALAEFLRRHAGDRPPSHAIVGYRLRDTLSQAGPVNRAVCRIDEAGWLQSIEEVTGIEPGSEAAAIVSMNLWGFNPGVFETLRAGVAEFFRSGDPTRGEVLLPAVMRSAVQRGDCRVRVLEPVSSWFGITHQADRPVVEAALRALVDAGRYPEQLWA